MKNVRVLSDTAPQRVPAAAHDAPPEPAVRTMSLADAPEPAPPVLPTPAPEAVRETTIEGGMRVRNGTGYCGTRPSFTVAGPGPDAPSGG